MANAKIDNNNIPTIIGVLNTNGITPTIIKANPIYHLLNINDGSSGSDLGGDIASRDDNGNITLTATDANNNIIPLYVDSSGNLMVKSS